MRVYKRCTNVFNFLFEQLVLCCILDGKVPKEKEFSTSCIHWSIETSMDVVVDNTKLIRKLLLLINIDQIIFFFNFILCKCCFFLNLHIDYFVHDIKHPSSLILIDIIVECHVWLLLSFNGKCYCNFLPY